MFDSFAVLQVEEVASFWRAFEVAYSPIRTVSSKFIIS